MTRTYQIDVIATIHSKLNIQFKGGQLTLEHLIEANSLDDDETSIFLSFNSIQSNNMFQYYKVDEIGDLLDRIYQHFTIYNSLKRFQNFFEKRSIYGTLSESALID